MMNNLIVRFTLLFSPLFAKLGVNTTQFEIVLRTKLLMDDRRPLTSFGNKPKKESNYSSWINFLLLAVMGCVLLLFLFSVNKPYLSYTIYFGVFMAMLCLTLIADFSVLLLDSRDNFIILPKPVNDRTLTVTRIVHIGISVFKQALGLALPGFIFTLFTKTAIGGAIFVLQVSIATVLCVLLVNMFYLIAMNFLSVKRFKDIVAYLQIVFSILIFALYYTMPSILESAMVQQIDFASTYWLWFTPSAWIGALQELGAGDFSVLALSLSVLALVVPFIALWLIISRFSSGFNAILSGLPTEDNISKEKVVIHYQSSFGRRLAKTFTHSPLESAGFEFVWALTDRTWEFKIKVYPSMAYVPVYFFFMFFVRNKGQGAMSFEERWQTILDQHTYLFIFYFSLFTLLTVFQFITQSEKYKAAWIYFVAPIQQPGLLMSGVLKAAFIKFYIPFMLAFTSLGLVFIGLPVLNDILLSTAVGGIAAILICLFTVTGYPFSQPLKKTEGRFIANLILIGLISVIGFGHYLAIKYEWLVWLLAGLFSGVFFLLLHYFKKESWEKAEFKD
jgi:ABC-2 type transport system permease protein